MASLFVFFRQRSLEPDQIDVRQRCVERLDEWREPVPFVLDGDRIGLPRRQIYKAVHAE